MLLRVDAVQEVGRFSSLKHKAPAFGRLSFIYARNGLGKSTLCSILRSAVEEDGKLIAARKRLGSVAESRVQTKWQTHGQIDFSGGKWNGCPGDVFIFDLEFVLRNLHVGESVTRDNKRNLVPVVLGAQGTSLAAKISNLDKEQREIVAAQAAHEKVVKTAHPSVSDMQAFADAPVPSDIDDKIASAIRALALAQSGMAVRQRRELTNIVLRSLDEFEELAERSIDDVSEGAASMVQTHLDQHDMHPNGSRWLKFGVDHMSGADCPFCTQDTTGIPLVAAFQGYFSEQFTQLTQDLDAALDEVKTLYGENGSAWDKLLADHAADFDFWGTVCDLTAVPTLSDEQRASATAALKMVQDLMSAKVKNPLGRQSLSVDQRAELATGIDAIRTYMRAVAAEAATIAIARTNASQADIAGATSTRNKLQALKAKASNPIKDEVEEWIKGAKRRLQIDADKKAAQNDLRAYAAATTGARQDDINALLELFGADFRICDTKASFVGREPNADYSIEIGNHRVNAGERADDKPSFNTILSAGDKFTLALAFFIAQVRSEPNLASAVIVFDDPFSSQDMQRQWETTSQLRALSKQACQVIVLSHDPRFLHLIEKNADKADCASFQIMCDDQGVASISDWSSEKELENAYVRSAQVIREYANKGVFLDGENADSVVKRLRPFAEDFIRARFPGRFASLVMLDAMANDIDTTGASDPLYNDVPAFKAINEYSRDHMHANSPPVNPAELRAQCRRIVAFLGHY